MEAENMVHSDSMSPASPSESVRSSSGGELKTSLTEGSARRSQQTLTIRLGLPEPVKVIVMEDRDAILPCSLGSGENIESRLFDWRKDYQKDGSKNVFMYDGKKQDLLRQSEQFRGRVSHFPDELKNGNASIKITETKLADGGNYTCIFPHLQPERKFNIELVVGAAPKPYVTIIKSDHGVLLQCEVLGVSPKPQLQWQDSDGNLVPAKDPQEEKRGGGYDIILQAAVTKTDTYRCVVTQKEIHHQTQAEIYVPPIDIMVNGGDFSRPTPQLGVKVCVGSVQRGGGRFGCWS
ncbi:hypothetical protein L3Q82_007456 [Scortum barcoo]|uniref:Uncharacterized protein n=1 Tax=Scortum barcoo TaxID=214431 RepID=A0ACB8WP32_9TELE|nr:hypothetical protein L3Q82_007456 [Scortum barcoo]